MKIWEDKDALTLAASKAYSIAEFLRLVNMPHQGANYKLAYEALSRFNLTLTGPAPIKSSKKIPNELVFIENSKYTNNEKIKKRLVEDYGWGYTCSDPGCPNPEPKWKELALSLHLDHINGVNNDNRFENLRFLCPNCHSQTETYGSRNNRRKAVPIAKPLCACGNSMSKKSKFCRKCSVKNRTYDKLPQIYTPKIDWPSTEEILTELVTKTYTQYAKELGTSDNAIRKHLKRRGITPPRKHKI